MMIQQLDKVYGTDIYPIGDKVRIRVVRSRWNASKTYAVESLRPNHVWREEACFSAFSRALRWALNWDNLYTVSP